MADDNILNLDEVRNKFDAQAKAQSEMKAIADACGFLDTDIANAKRLIRLYGTKLHYTVETGWLVWSGQQWAIDEKDVRIQALAKDTVSKIYDEIKVAANETEMFRHARRSQSKKAIEAMIWLARSEPGIYVKLADFDRDPFLLNVLNGTLNLKTGKLRDHNRDDLITKLVPIEYDTQADCELWDKFLARVTDENQNLYDYLRRLTGYLLTGITTEQVLHFLFGLGANGKSVFCEVLNAILGDYAVIVSPDLIMLRRHGGIPNDIARLRGARAALMNETTQGSRFDESKLKDLTGGDSLTARFLHREFFDFAPTHKLLIRGNHKPAITGTDEAIWRRLRLVPFAVQIPTDEQDMNLLAKLRTERPGILRWAVEGCLEWQRDGLKPPECVMAAVNEYRHEADTLGRFIDEQCEVRTLAQIKSSAFFQRYQQFAEQAGERWIPSKDLPSEMERRGFEHKKIIAGMVYLGLEFTQQDGQSWTD